MPDFNDVVKDVYDLFQTENGHLDLDQLLKDHADEFTDVLRKRLESIGSERGNYLRISNIGKPDRQLWYDINWKGEVEGLHPAAHIKFLYGDLIEQMVLFLVQAAGHTVEFQQKEVDVDGIKGHMDCVIDGVVTDVKSASSYSWKKFESGSLLEEGNDPFGYVAQLSGYVEGISPGADGAFLAVDKTLGKVCTLRIPNEVLRQYNVRNRIEHAKEMVSVEHPPEKCYPPKPEGKSGNYSLAIGCSYCKHKLHCWSDANNGEGLKMYAYATGPKWFTHIEKEPRVSQVGVDEF